MNKQHSVAYPDKDLSHSVLSCTTNLRLNANANYNSKVIAIISMIHAHSKNQSLFQFIINVFQ